MRKWRKMTWTLIVWTALIGVWVVLGTRSAMDPADAAACVADSGGVLSLDDCRAAQEIGTGVGVVLVLGVGFAGFVALSLIWFMSRPRVAVATADAS